jgi:integrase
MARLLHQLGYGPDRTTVHGFRSAFSSWAHARTTVPTDIIEMALAHQFGDQVARAYMRDDLVNRRRALVEMWAAFCYTPADGSKVIAIGGAR